MEEQMHRFELFSGTWLDDDRIANISPTETHAAVLVGDNYSYVWHVPAHKADAFRNALRTKIAQHNQHFNMPQLTVFESIGWGFSQP